MDYPFYLCRRPSAAEDIFCSDWDKDKLPVNIWASMLASTEENIRTSWQERDEPIS